MGYLLLNPCPMKKIVPISAVLGVMALALAIPAFAQQQDEPLRPKSLVQQEPQSIRISGGIPSTAVAPMEDVINGLRQTPYRSSRITDQNAYSLPMVNIGTDTSAGFSPLITDFDGDGKIDLVYSQLIGNEVYQALLLNMGGYFDAVYTCAYTNANDPSGQFTYRGTCADMR